MIHTILILKKTGENIFSKSFGQTNMNETLTSGFISAAFSFTQLNFSANIEEIEIGPFRLFFESGENFIITAFFDKADSIINVRKKLRALREKITENYGEIIEKNMCCVDDFKEIESIIEEIVSISNRDKKNNGLIEDYKNILEKLRSNAEILDCDLISISTGLPLVHKWNKEYLNLCLSQIDAFWKSKQFMLDQIILTYEQRHLILFKISENYVLSSLIRRETPLGLATLLIEDATIKIKRLGS
ncbi:MAG: hypothetical protein ACFFBP_18780 [Promethearchaeota archaeon]